MSERMSQGSITRAVIRLTIHTVRALELMLPPWCLQLLLWPAAAVVSGWQLAWVGRLPSSLRPAGSPPTRIWRQWEQRINLNMTKLLVLWPDRLITPRWRRRCDGAALQQLMRLSAEDQPVVLAVLHFGPLSVLKYWMRAHGLAVASLVRRPLSQRPAHRVYLDNLNDAASGFDGIPHLFDLSQVRQAVQFLQPHRLLTVAMEGGEDHRGHELVVEGDDYLLPVAMGAIRLAARAKGLIVPCLALAHRPFGLTLHVGKPVSAEGDPCAVCAHLMREFIPVLSAHPGQCERKLIRSFQEPASRPTPAVRAQTA